MEGKMNRATKCTMAACALWALLPLAARIAAQPGTTPEPQSDSQRHHSSNGKPAAPAASSDGERVFKQNCSRCHDAPQSFSPRISYAIVRHMRVRASLSAADEKALLQFMNP
jgi:cytochrome c5